MPHKCTACGRVFPDGSTEMLSGCPDCGGNRFQFAPDADTDAGSDPTPSSDPKPGSIQDPDPDHGPASSPDGEDRAQASARADVVSEDELSVSGKAPGTRSSTPENPDSAPDPDTGGDPEPDRDHDRDRDEPGRTTDLPPDSDPEPGSDAGADQGDPTTDRGDDRPDLTELREELNEQFESIRILGPGQYELNLMELYDRRECVISLREDGRYVIEMPDAWGASGPGPDADAGPDA